MINCEQKKDNENLCLISSQARNLLTEEAPALCSCLFAFIMHYVLCNVS